MDFSMSWLLVVLPMAVNGFTFSCPSQHILALVSANANEIDMNGAPVTVCGETRACTYTKGAPCVAKGQYAAGISEIKGNVVHGCCQISPPVQDHQGDECHPYIIETTDYVRLTAARPPQLPRGPPRPSGGGAGKGPPTPPKEQVLMVNKNLPPGIPNQYVKSIIKLGGGVQGYTVTVCTPQCGRSTTTRRTTPRVSTQKPRSDEHQQQQQHQEEVEQQQEVPPPTGKHPKKGLLGGGHHCFSSDMTVTTPFGSKRMDEIRVGDQVLVVSSDSRPVFEPVEWLYHRDPDAEADFITVSTKSGRTLRLSPNHLIPFVPCSTEELHSRGVDYFANAQSFFARRLKVGSCIATLTNNEMVSDQVVTIRKEQKRGIYSPITNQGTIIVNDVYVSCYSSVENHVAQRSVHSTLITLRHAISTVWKSVFGSALDKEDSNVPLPLKMLLKLAQLIVPSNVFVG